MSVAVIGIGGVGSHVAHLLLRGGVRKLRIVDFDQVTLSSLNRHATAVRLDVGTAKAIALKAALLRIAPDASIDARVELFDDASAARLLEDDPPSLVIDCIDDLATKAALLGHCVRLDVPVLCALGAGGKADACCLHVGRLSEVFNDPIAASLLKRLRKEKQQLAAGGAIGAGGSSSAAVTEDCWEELVHLVGVVYSSEQQRVSLLPLPTGMAASDLGSQPNFRVRVLPVLPPLPAAVGAALAAHALSVLSGATLAKTAARPVPPLSSSYLTKLHRKFVQHEAKERPGPSGEVAVSLSLAEAALLVHDVFRCRCALTGKKLHDPQRPVFCLVRFDKGRDADVANVLFATTEAAAAHEREGLDALPLKLRTNIEQSIARGLAGRRISKASMPSIT